MGIPLPVEALSAQEAQGLTEAEATDRLAEDGPNVIPEAKPHPAWRLLVAEMVHFFALLLWVAAGLAFIAQLPELGIAIILVIIINGVFAFVQERRAERAAEKLRDLMPRTATVVRDGLTRTIDAQDLVTGDLVVLEPGDRVSADGVIVDAQGFTVDVSMLTGESAAVPLGDGGAVHAGTFAIDGRARVLVTKTGATTRLAAIAALTRKARRPRSPLTIELDRVVRTIAIIAISVGFACFLLALGLGTPATDGFLFAIGVTVALVPEGLLPTVTVSLAIGAQRMADRRALVRHLEAVETLGSTTVICTDKTGTLTCNVMTVVRWWTPSGIVEVAGEGYGPSGTVTGEPLAVAAARVAARAAATASSATVLERGDTWSPVGDPMEAAFVGVAGRLDGGRSFERPTIDRLFPFDPVRRRMSVVTGETVLVKGAPDAIVPRCRSVDPMASEVIDAWAAEGLRLVAVASRGWTPGADAAADDVEADLELLGIAALEDPPRAEAAAALAAARAAGIRVVMVTGDHPATAAAIGREVGLMQPGSPVLVGADLPEEPVALAAVLGMDGTVVARVDPEMKLRIAQALQAEGGVVAMTGDGVNDGPALQAADTGIAMGRSGTDIARAAADVVLLDDNFATIVQAIEQGRATYFNVRRFLTYHLTDNVAELIPFVVWALSGGRVPLALTVLQVLAIDIGTDIFPALALGAEPASQRVLTRPPPRLHLLDRALLGRVFGVLGPALALSEMAAFFAVLISLGWTFEANTERLGPVLMASGTAFAAVTLGQMANAFACRSSSRVPWRLSRRNPYVWRALVAGGVILVCLVGIPPIATFFGMANPPWWGWLLAALAAPVVLVADALEKGVRAFRIRRRSR